jgi:phosphatidylglycerophosphate synthase
MMMKIGIYDLKYPFRKMISLFLPLVKNFSPNAISWSLIPIGIATAICYYFTGPYPVLFLVGFFLIYLRLVVGTLDGLVAVKYNKSTPKGEIVNRIAPELCDIMLMLAIILSSPERYFFGIIALVIAWFTTFAGLIGLAGGKEIDMTGPVAQADRIFILSFFSLLGFFFYIFDIHYDVLLWFLIWCIAGGCITIILRIVKILKSSK